MRRGKRKQPKEKLAANHRTNERIRVPKIRLVGDNVEPGVYDTRNALRMAEDLELDLVEISPKADPPVCKIIDYSKFMYDQRKKQKELAAKAVKVVIKEIRFGPNTSDHDYEFKKKHAIEFLQSGAKVKAFVFFRGRSIVFKDKGEILLLRLAQDLEEYGKVEHMPSMDGKKMNITIAPKK
ncbi:translation initiation factor IF-3 [Schleiferiaceae bacterium]|nr:translation initiation factor IF-3 [Schleiferiaceae bacterium]MDA8570813.1 translation initiation factor IF-3 [Schleiferiaceae bacterium]MDA8820526.1 translation initiation factor IF-3 [Schleiferiaceae bacterium]MDB2473625.1 translation initiation factor IF-3 [Schleiferiaceae bacterium]PSR07025.1 MAG: translation initiation factor IF-3 [Bacteroidota bacterium]